MNTFIPKPGQVDFINIRWCPVVNCVVKCGEEFLIVKRSADMRLYPNYWNGISGFIDDTQSLEEKVYEELHEELGVTKEEVAKITLRGVFNQEASDIQKTWIVHAVRVDLVLKPTIMLDREASQYTWITVGDIMQFDLMPGFNSVVDLVFGEANRTTRL